jgi:hypothetical protein
MLCLHAFCGSRALESLFCSEPAYLPDALARSCFSRLYHAAARCILVLSIRCQCLRRNATELTLCVTPLYHSPLLSRTTCTHFSNHGHHHCHHPCHHCHHHCHHRCASSGLSFLQRFFFPSPPPTMEGGTALGRDNPSATRGGTAPARSNNLNGGEQKDEDHEVTRQSTDYPPTISPPPARPLAHAPLRTHIRPHSSTLTRTQRMR